MKRLVKSKITKHILGIMFVVAVMFASLQMNTETTHAASFSKAEMSNPTFYESGCLKSLKVTIQAAGSYAEAYGKIGIHTSESPYTWSNRYISGNNTTSWPEVINDSTLIALSSEEFSWYQGNECSTVVQFEDGSIPCNQEKTYVVHLWTRAIPYGIYTDYKFADLKTSSDGTIYFGDKKIEEDKDIKEVNAVIEKIATIGTVENTEECKAKIDAARAAYAALTEEQKAKITAEQYKILTDAEEAYDIKVVEAVIEKINSIGTVENTDESKAKIDAAKEAYDALTEAQKAKITAEQYKVLTNAEDAYDGFNNNGKYEDVKPSSGSVTDITGTAGTDKAQNQENPYSVVIKNNTESELESIMGITASEKAQGVNVWLEVIDASATMPSEDKDKINNSKGEQTVGLYLDASIFKKVGSNTEEKVHELNGKIKVSMIIPEILRKEGRTFSLVRVHNGVVENLGGTYDASTYTFTFETDKFSSYAILYKDPASGGNPSEDDDNDNGSGNNESGSIGNGSGSNTVGNNTTGNTAGQVTAPTTATSPSPKTGDTNALALWIALAFAALLSGTTVAIKSKNN